MVLVTSSVAFALKSSSEVKRSAVSPVARARDHDAEEGVHGCLP